MSACCIYTGSISHTDKALCPQVIFQLEVWHLFSTACCCIFQITKYLNIIDLIASEDLWPLTCTREILSLVGITSGSCGLMGRTLDLRTVGSNSSSAAYQLSELGQIPSPTRGLISSVKITHILMVSKPHSPAHVTHSLSLNVADLCHLHVAEQKYDSVWGFEF